MPQRDMHIRFNPLDERCMFVCVYVVNNTWLFVYVSINQYASTQREGGRERKREERERESKKENQNELREDP